MRKSYTLLFIIIVFTAAIPRAVELLSGNYLFGFDQGLFFEAVKKIVIEKKPALIGSEVGGQGGFFQGAGWYYLLLVPFILTNGNPYAGMILMFAIGIATVILAVIFAKKMFDAKTALVIGFLIAVSPAIIPESRFIWPPFPISLLTIFFLYFLYRVFEKKGKYFPLATFILGIISHFEVATAGTLLLQTIFLSPVLFLKKCITPRWFLFAIFSFFITLIPLFIFDLRHNFLITRGVLRLSGGGSPINPSHQVTLFYVKAMFYYHLNTFRDNFLSVFQMNGLLWPLILFMLLFGSFQFLKDKKNNTASRFFVIYLISSPIIIFIIFMLYEWPMWEWWLSELRIYYCFLLAIIFHYFWKKIWWRPFIIGLCVLFFVSYAQQTIGFYKNDLYDYGGTHKIRGKIDAIDYIYKDAKGEKFGLLVFTPPVYTYAYDYLVWWHGQKNYHYTPHGEKKGLFYLLIEPDPHKPWTYEGWLETVVKTGTILETKKLPSGFIVQKRKE